MYITARNHLDMNCRFLFTSAFEVINTARTIATSNCICSYVDSAITTYVKRHTNTGMFEQVIALLLHIKVGIQEPLIALRSVVSYQFQSHPGTAIEQRQAPVSHT